MSYPRKGICFKSLATKRYFPFFCFSSSTHCNPLTPLLNYQGFWFCQSTVFPPYFNHSCGCFSCLLPNCRRHLALSSAANKGWSPGQSCACRLLCSSASEVRTLSKVTFGCISKAISQERARETEIPQGLEGLKTHVRMRATDIYGTVSLLILAQDDRLSHMRLIV